MPDHHDEEMIHKKIDTNTEEPAAEVASLIAEIEGKDTTEVENMWGCTDHALDHLFSNPPAPEAQMQIKFSYEGYRITVEQDGSVKLIKTG